MIIRNVWLYVCGWLVTRQYSGDGYLYPPTPLSWAPVYAERAGPALRPPTREGGIQRRSDAVGLRPSYRRFRP